MKKCVVLAPLTFLILVVEMVNEAAVSPAEDAPFRSDAAAGVSVSLTPVRVLPTVWERWLGGYYILVQHKR